MLESIIVITVFIIWNFRKIFLKIFSVPDVSNVKFQQENKTENVTLSMDPPLEGTPFEQRKNSENTFACSTHFDDTKKKKIGSVWFT